MNPVFVEFEIDGIAVMVKSDTLTLAKATARNIVHGKCTCGENISITADDLKKALEAESE